jgi:hypothetical protein
LAIVINRPDWMVHCSKKQRPGAAEVLDSRQKQRIIAMVCSDPPEGQARWTVRLVAEEAVKRKLVPRVGRETIRILLLHHDLKPWRGKNVVRHPTAIRNPVRSFPTFTEDLHRLADWLKACGIQTVAMEATGVYWIPLFQILETQGFEVCLVNARYYQNVPGRRTDVSDCQWMRYLHSVGLLRPSFRPVDQVCVLRSLLRHRESLIQSAATHLLRMQKALDQMNLQIHHVISDITGLTGLRIIDAILEGQRDPKSSRISGMGGSRHRKKQL